MAKPFFTLAVLCVFGAIMVEGFNGPVVRCSLSVLETCKSMLEANDGDVQELIDDATNMSKKAKCLLACVMKKIELMDDNGKFMADTALGYVKKNTGVDDKNLKIAKEIIDICAYIKVDNDPCEAASQYEECVKEHLDVRKLF